MPLENANKVSELNENWPLGSDTMSQGDDHIRMIKKVLKSHVSDVGAHLDSSISTSLLTDNSYEIALANTLPTVNVLQFAPVGTARLTSAEVQNAFDECPASYRLTFAGAAVDFTETVTLNRALHIDFADADLVVKTGFVGTEVFQVGFAPENAYITSGSFVNLSMTFESSEDDIDVFYVSRVARWAMRDVHIYNQVGTLFNEASIGHEWTCENIFCYSADVENGAGIWINFSDSYFTNLKSIGFSEYGIVNDGPDNRFYGCHPWSYPRSQPGFTAFTTKILFWDKEDGMWDSCYADTFQRKDPLQPPSFANGGIAFYFSKVSGIGRMVNCGFYALDTDVDSLIGIATDAGPQQINVVNGYVLGSNPDAYLKFVDVPSAAVAVNLFGCNFSEIEYQAKETINGSALLSNNEFYIQNRDNAGFNSLQTKLRTFAPRRSSHGLLMFEDNGTQHRLFVWDKYFGAQGSLAEIYSSSYSVKVYRSLSQLGLSDSDYSGSTSNQFYADVVAAVIARGGFPARLELDVNNSATPNLISIGAFPGPGYSYEGKLLAADRFTMQAQSYAGDFFYTGRYSTTFSGWASH